MLKGIVYPVLARYRKFMWASRDIVEVVSIIIQVGNDIQTYSRELPQLLEPQDVFQLTLKNLKKKYELDDEFYPDSDIVRIGLSKSISDIKTIQDKISVDIDNANIGGLKWPAYKEVENYIKSSPNNYIELTKK